MEEFLKKLEESINNISAWGKKEIYEADSLQRLENQLVGIYGLYFEGRDLTGAKEIATSPDFDMTTILKMVRKNLPELGTFPLASAIDESSEEIEWKYTDAAESLTRIIYELLVVQWHLKISQPGEALWQFLFCFERYMRPHMTGLIFYLSQYHEHMNPINQRG